MLFRSLIEILCMQTLGSASCMHYIVELVPNIKGIQESTASCREVKCESILQPQLTEDDRCCRRELVVRCRGCYNQCIDCIRINASLLNQLLGSFTRQIAGSEAFLCIALGKDLCCIGSDKRTNSPEWRE